MAPSLDLDSKLILDQDLYLECIQSINRALRTKL